MYSILLQINKRFNDYKHQDKATIGVRMKDGQIRYYLWRGFTLEMVRPVKCQVHAFTSDREWDPRRPNSKMPQWVELKNGEYLVGSYNGKRVQTYLPFTVCK